ncbi:MAG: FMN-binding glutamate synthase family protein [Thermoplasmatota archaeon]
MREEEIRRKASSGTVRLVSGCPGRRLPGLEELSICPARLAGRFPVDVFEGVETDVTIGTESAKDPLSLQTPVFVPAPPLGEVGRAARLALAYGASLAGTALASGEGGLTPEERAVFREFRGKSMVSWGPARYGASPDQIRSGDAVVVELCGTGRGSTSALWRVERTAPVQAELYGAPMGFDWVTPPHPLDIEYPEDLRLHIELLRELTDHRVPVVVRMGAARVHEETKLAVEAGADAVWLEALEAPLYGAPAAVVEDVGIPLLAVFAPARAALEETGARERGVKLLVSGGVSEGSEVFKALALGADAVGVPEGARVALGCSEGGGGDCHTGRCPTGIATLDPELETRLDWKTAGSSLGNYIAALTDELKVLTAATGHLSTSEVGPEDLRALTYDAAALTGVKLAGYERQLPMWMH